MPAAIELHSEALARLRALTKGAAVQRDERRAARKKTQTEGGGVFDAFEKARNAELKPMKLSSTMAFMFETRFPQQVSRFAAETDSLQNDYIDCWAGLDRRFDGTPDPK